MQPVSKQWLGKHASTTERLDSMLSAPRPLLCNGAVTSMKNRNYVFCVIRAEELSLRQLA
jgi:hypothetical protein